MDSVGSANRQVVNTSLPLDVNAQELSRLPCRTLLTQTDFFSRSSDRVDSPFESPVFPLRLNWHLLDEATLLCKTELTEEAPKVIFCEKTCCSVSALQGEEASMSSVISLTSGRTDRVCRSTICAETRATGRYELFSLRYQQSEMMGNSNVNHSPDVMAGMVFGACAIDSKGSYDKMQHTVITSQG